MHNVKKHIDHVLEQVLLFLETVIALFTVVVLVGLLLMEIAHICTDPAAFIAGEDTVTAYLHEMLTIVVGLEFVKLLMHLTPANILEVLIMAISRGIIVSHGDAVENLLSILCIVALFAAKRFLIPRAELHKGMDEQVEESHHRSHRNGRNHKKQPEKQAKQESHSS